MTSEGAVRWVPPPTWPDPPPGWVPPPGWAPDPAWGPAPPGWEFWRPAAAHQPAADSAAGRDAPSPQRVHPVTTSLPTSPALPPLPPRTGVAAPERRSLRPPRPRLLVAGSALAAVVLAAAAVVSDDAPARPDRVRTLLATAAPAVPSSAAAAPSTSAEPPGPGTALALLATLEVKGRAPRTGYDRAAFGPAWADTDRNGCDTRNDVLARDLTGEAFRPGTRNCVVVSGYLAEPYTGRTVAFSKPEAGAVQIDHVVSLSNAWQTGAFAWSARLRLLFANDPLNLLAVDGGANAAKSDGDAATWLPPNKAYRCPMVARQTAVKAKYALWVTAAERDAIARVLSSCPGEPAPGGGTPTTEATAPAATGAGPRDYANCAEMHVDHPGGVARPGAVDRRARGGRARYAPRYDQALYDANAESDRDRDGVACER